MTAVVRQFGLGLAAGGVGGMLLTRLIRWLTLPISLVPLFTLTGALTVFGVTNLAGSSGFLAIYIAGAIFSAIRRYLTARTFAAFTTAWPGSARSAYF